MPENQTDNNLKRGERFAEDWLLSRNQRDLEAILSHYAEEIELRSRMAAHLLGDPSGAVIGKRNLREYIQKILTLVPGDLELELLGVYEGVGSMVVHFKSTGGAFADYGSQRGGESGPSGGAFSRVRRELGLANRWRNRRFLRKTASLSQSEFCKPPAVRLGIVPVKEELRHG